MWYAENESCDQASHELLHRGLNTYVTAPIAAAVKESHPFSWLCSNLGQSSIAAKFWAVTTSNIGALMRWPLRVLADGDVVPHR